MEDVFALDVICMWKPMDRSRDSEAAPETRGAPVDRQRQILIQHYNSTGQDRTGHNNLSLQSHSIINYIITLYRTK